MCMCMCMGVNRGWVVSADTATWSRSLPLHEIRMAPEGYTYGMGPTIGIEYQALPGIDDSQTRKWHHILVTWNGGNTYGAYHNFNESVLEGGGYEDIDGIATTTIGGHPS